MRRGGGDTVAGVMLGYRSGPGPVTPLLGHVFPLVGLVSQGPS